MDYTARYDHTTGEGFLFDEDNNYVGVAPSLFSRTGNLNNRGKLYKWFFKLFYSFRWNRDRRGKTFRAEPILVHDDPYSFRSIFGPPEDWFPEKYNRGFTFTDFLDKFKKFCQIRLVRNKRECFHKMPPSGKVSQTTINIEKVAI